MKAFTTDYLQVEIQKSHPRTLISYFLRLGRKTPALRTELLKCIDSGRSKEFYRAFPAFEKDLPVLIRLACHVGKSMFSLEVSDSIVRFAIDRLFAPYFLLVNEKAFWKIKKRFEKEGAGIILDVVGEEALFQGEADAYLENYRSVMERHGSKVAVKLSSLVPSLSFNSSNYEENKRVLGKKFSELLLLASRCHASITLDAEEYFKWCLLVEDVFCETIVKPPFHDMSNIGIALQAYRKDAFTSAERFLAVAKKRECPLLVRLVKGAYWDTEWVVARQNGWNYPLFEIKEETDANFDRIVSFFLQHRKDISLAVATHNPKNIAHALEEARGNFVNFEIQVLFGLGEAVRRTLCRLKIPVSVYLPFGESDKGMAYLVRRILENTAGNSCLFENLS